MSDMVGNPKDRFFSQRGSFNYRQRNSHTTVTEKQITQKKAILEKTTKASNDTGKNPEILIPKMLLYHYYP